MEFWFRRKYLLPPTDPRFLDATHEMMLTDLYAWRAFEKPGEEEFETDDEDFEAAVSAFMADDDEWEDVPLNSEGQ